MDPPLWAPRWQGDCFFQPVNTSPASSAMLGHLIIWGTNASLQGSFPHDITCKPAGVKWQASTPRLLPSLVGSRGGGGGSLGHSPTPPPAPPLWAFPPLPQNMVGQGGPQTPALAPLQNLSYLSGWEVGLFAHHPHPRPLREHKSWPGPPIACPKLSRWGCWDDAVGELSPTVCLKWQLWDIVTLMKTKIK